jgi:hypothetical protein
LTGLTGRKVKFQTGYIIVEKGKAKNGIAARGPEG